MRLGFSRRRFRWRTRRMRGLRFVGLMMRGGFRRSGARRTSQRRTSTTTRSFWRIRISMTRGCARCMRRARQAVSGDGDLSKRCGVPGAVVQDCAAGGAAVPEGFDRSGCGDAAVLLVAAGCGAAELRSVAVVDGAGPHEGLGSDGVELSTASAGSVQPACAEGYAARGHADGERRSADGGVYGWEEEQLDRAEPVDGDTAAACGLERRAVGADGAHELLRRER